MQRLQPTNIPILSYDIPQLRSKDLRVTSRTPRLQFFLDWHAAGHAACGALMGNATLLSSLKVPLLRAPPADSPRTNFNIAAALRLPAMTSSTCS